MYKRLPRDGLWNTFAATAVGGILLGGAYSLASMAEGFGKKAE